MRKWCILGLSVLLLITGCRTQTQYSAETSSVDLPASDGISAVDPSNSEEIPAEIAQLVRIVDLREWGGMEMAVEREVQLAPGFLTPDARRVVPLMTDNYLYLQYERADDEGATGEIYLECYDTTSGALLNRIQLPSNSPFILRDGSIWTLQPEGIVIYDREFQPVQRTELDIPLDFMYRPDMPIGFPGNYLWPALTPDGEAIMLIDKQGIPAIYQIETGQMDQFDNIILPVPGGRLRYFDFIATETPHIYLLSAYKWDPGDQLTGLILEILYDARQHRVIFFVENYRNGRIAVDQVTGRVYHDPGGVLNESQPNIGYAVGIHYLLDHDSQTYYRVQRDELQSWFCPLSDSAVLAYDYPNDFRVQFFDLDSAMPVDAIDPNLADWYLPPDYSNRGGFLNRPIL